MSPERWQEIGEVFGAALELANGERRHFLDRVCEDDSELRREVHRLLAADDESPSFLEEPVCRLAPEDETDEERRIGPYRLERTLAKGGMGTVYLASRDDQEYQRRVAVKLVRRDLTSPELLLRFRNERQFLAALEHPSIARLYDGGTTADGRPYLVMEYVDGLPITEYCNHGRLTVRERLKLFLKVCDAVRHAHRNLLVHRDIKPSNILVTGDGVPKLLDFGIAKLLDRAEIFEAVDTHTSGGHVMTPNYASPEQIGRETVTTLSDVYSLGVLLYELLTGRLPHHTSGRLLHEIQLAIYQEKPERPSRAVFRVEESRPGVTAETVARDRSTRPTELARRLSGDLDLILRKALRKEPERRYGSVGQLAEDVSLHLRHRPVRARPDTLIYRAGKYVRRHPVGVTAAALVALIVFGFLAMISRQSEVIEDQRHHARTVTRDLTDFLHDQGSARINRGGPAEGETLLAKALETSRRHAGEEQVAVAEVKEALALARWSRADFGNAEALLLDALDTREKVCPVSRNYWAADAMSDLAALYFRTGRLPEAEAMTEAARRQRSMFADYRPGRAASLGDQARLYFARGDFVRAERLYRQALGLRRAVLAEQAAEEFAAHEARREVANSLHDLARCLGERGAYEEAETLFVESFTLTRQLGEGDSPQAATLLNNLAVVLGNKGDHTAAEALFGRAEAMRLRFFGREHPHVA